MLRIIIFFFWDIKMPLALSDQTSLYIEKAFEASTSGAKEGVLT